MQVGTKVGYSRKWLQSTGQYTGAIPFARGTITKIINLGQTILAEVDWGTDDFPPKVNIANLWDTSKPEPQ